VYGLVGPLCIAGACLCWAIDNNLTRHVAATDALFIAGVKGLVAGTVNVGLAFLWGALWPPAHTAGLILVLGFLSYGVSLVLFVLALRGLGTARTGAYFSTAPFIGAVIALVVFQESTTVWFWIAAVCMGSGVWFHVSERHEHEHRHDTLQHHHRHLHDAHHQHAHAEEWDGQAPHSHPHAHQPVTHSHPHYPDIHHRHPHAVH
jgi:drug/metabolite transporter (DMT)-like permease